MRCIGRSHQQVRQASHSPLLHRERDDHPQMLVTRGGSSVGIEVDAKARRVESAAPWLRKIASVIEAVPPARTTSGRCRVGIRAGSASDLCRPLRACAAPCWKRRWASRAACKVCGAIPYADRIRASTAGRGRRREEAPAGLFITGACPKSGFDRLSAGCPSAKAAPEPVL